MHSGRHVRQIIGGAASSGRTGPLYQIAQGKLDCLQPRNRDMTLKYFWHTTHGWILTGAVVVLLIWIVLAPT